MSPAEVLEGLSGDRKAAILVVLLGEEATRPLLRSLSKREVARIAREAVARGHQVQALVSEWQGEPLQGVTITTVPVRGRSNHGRMARFAAGVQQYLAETPHDRVLGFNRLPGLDVYFAADSCFAEHVAGKPGVVRWLPRYATYLKLEHQVVAESGPLLLFLMPSSRRQRFHGAS